LRVRGLGAALREPHANPVEQIHLDCRHLRVTPGREGGRGWCGRIPPGGPG
jgi:hypothetical protein